MSAASKGGELFIVDTSDSDSRGLYVSAHGGRGAKLEIPIWNLKFVRRPPLALTEQGVAMLSSVLRSQRAVQVNIAIMRAFVQLREVLAGHAELAAKLAELERRIAGHDATIRSLFSAIRQLMNPRRKRRREIGFHAVNK